MVFVNPYAPYLEVVLGVSRMRGAARATDLEVGLRVKRVVTKGSNRPILQGFKKFLVVVLEA